VIYFADAKMHACIFCEQSATITIMNLVHNYEKVLWIIRTESRDPSVE